MFRHRLKQLKTNSASFTKMSFFLSLLFKYIKKIKECFPPCQSVIKGVFFLYIIVPIKIIFRGKNFFSSNLNPHIKLDFKRTYSFSLGPDQPYTFLNSFVL